MRASSNQHSRGYKHVCIGEFAGPLLDCQALDRLFRYGSPWSSGRQWKRSNTREESSLEAIGNIRVIPPRYSFVPSLQRCTAGIRGGNFVRHFSYIADPIQYGENLPLLPGSRKCFIFNPATCTHAASAT